MGEAASASGPDLSRGIKLAEIGPAGTIAGRIGDEPVLLSRLDGQLFAVSGACTHYGAALAEGLIDGDCVRCPLHHACFNLKTGAVLRAPALDPLDRWQIEIEGEMAFVRERQKAVARNAPDQGSGVDKVVIVGGGAAGLACANELCRLAFSGAITMLSADSDPPCDRPNLSKDYLAGTASEEWIPLRASSWYGDNEIGLRLGMQVASIDARRRNVLTSTGERVPFDRLLLATGSEPNRLAAPGFDRPNVRTLRSLADARALVELATPGSRAAIIGSSFIGLETAAALRTRGVEVAIVSIETVPFERVLGRELGEFLQRLHEQHGVDFHLGRAVAAYDGRSLRLSDGRDIPADFILVGIGVRPRLELAATAGIAADDGVPVNSQLETSATGVFAAGDIASYPDPLTGESIRIEHWVTAERQGQTVAANMLGMDKTFDAVPFFWSEQYGVALRYVGRSPGWDEVAIEGDMARRFFVARYFENGVHRATASVGNDRANLEDELRLERRLRNPRAPVEPESQFSITSNV